MLQNAYVDQWFFNPRRSYHYLMAGFVWARFGSAALYDQTFPWHIVPLPLMRTSMVTSANTAMVRFDRENGANKLAPDYASAMIIPDLGRPEVLPSKFYDPNVILRRSGIRQVFLAGGGVAFMISPQHAL